MAERDAASTRRADLANLDACTQCGLCNAVCPTYLPTADERDGPRGRIAMMRYAADRGGNLSNADGGGVVFALDRCLQCGACDSACPEGVPFAAAIEGARSELSRYRQLSPAQKKARRSLLREVTVGRSGRGPFAALSGPHDPGEFAGPGAALTHGQVKGRVLLLPGCRQKAVRPAIADATIRLLGRRGIDVVVAPGTECCGAIAEQLADIDLAHEHAMANARAWTRTLEATAAETSDRGEIDAVITTGAVCRSEVRRSVHRIALGGDVSGQVLKLMAAADDAIGYLASIDFGAPDQWSSMCVGYFSGCRAAPDPLAPPGIDVDPGYRLLTEAGYSLVPLNEADVCCGGPGAFAELEPGVAEDVRRRKLERLSQASLDIVAVADPGCISLLSGDPKLPVVHAIELLDWAHGGPVPQSLEGHVSSVTRVPRPSEPVA